LYWEGFSLTVVGFLIYSLGILSGAGGTLLRQMCCLARGITVRDYHKALKDGRNIYFWARSGQCWCCETCWAPFLADLLRTILGPHLKSRVPDLTVKGQSDTLQTAFEEVVEPPSLMILAPRRVQGVSAHVTPHMFNGLEYGGDYGEGGCPGAEGNPVFDV